MTPLPVIILSTQVVLFSGRRPKEVTDEHSHQVVGDTWGAGSHTHGIQGNNFNTGGATPGTNNQLGATNIMPPYYALCFIMKTAN